MATIRTNVPSTISTIELQRAQRAQATAARINSAADDAAGLAIGKKLLSSLASANEGLRNAGDALSTLDLADAGLSGISDAASRVRELAVQASNGTLSADDQKAIATQVQKLTGEIGAIAGRTKFNGVSLLNQAGGALSFQVGADAGQTITVQLSNFSIGAGTQLASFSALAGSLAGAAGTGSYPSLAQGLLKAADGALDLIGAKRAELGATQRQVESTLAAQQVAVENGTAAEGRLTDVNLARASAQRVNRSIIAEAQIALLAQANQSRKASARLLAT